MDEYEQDEYELEEYQPTGPEQKKAPWFGAASMLFGVLAFGTAFLSYLAASAAAKSFKLFRENDREFSICLIVLAITILITVGSAFGCVAAGLIALVRGERSQWLLLPGLPCLGALLLCGLLVLIFVVGRLA